LNDATHGFAGKMSDQDFNDLANFLTKGQFDIDAVIDRESKLAINGDNSKGESYYNTVCAGCHAETGTEPSGMPPLGALSHKNPWEVIQKVMNGQPDAEMPAMRAFGVQVGGDILSYLQTLPKE
jgi:mono/diheme cytochrome c family protein